MIPGAVGAIVEAAVLPVMEASAPMGTTVGSAVAVVAAADTQDTEVAVTDLNGAPYQGLERDW